MKLRRSTFMTNLHFSRALHVLIRNDDTSLAHNLAVIRVFKNIIASIITRHPIDYAVPQRTTKTHKPPYARSAAGIFTHKKC